MLVQLLLYSLLEKYQKIVNILDKFHIQHHFFYMNELLFPWEQMNFLLAASKWIHLDLYSILFIKKLSKYLTENIIE